MGWWTLEASKQDTEGNDIELNMDDLGHIAEAIQQGFTSGAVYDLDEEEEDSEA